MRFLVLLSLVAILAACAPAATSVSFTLPPTPGGRMCAHQCAEARDYCDQTCDLKQRKCVMEVQTRAMSDYDNYARAQFFNHEPIELNARDFERQAPCTDAHKSCGDDCGRPYQSCFEDCGGQVAVTSSCQFLCF